MMESISNRGRLCLKALREFGGYIAVIWASIPNYGDRFHHGEPISTAFAESTIDQVVSKRMVKGSRCGGFSVGRTTCYRCGRRC